MSPNAELRTPTERVCERCGRRERWDAEADAWLVVRDDDGPAVGSVHCVHEWDINGRFLPFGVEGESGTATEAEGER